MKEAIVAEELRNGQAVNRWTVDGRSGKVEAEPFTLQQHSRGVTWLRDAFLPQGYPQSVTEDYLGERA
jgi:hypothetical protein